MTGGNRRLGRCWVRGMLAAVAALLLSVAGVTEEGAVTQRTVHFSDWPGAGEETADETGVTRVGSFTVGKSEAEKFVGGLFEEWRDVVVPEFTGFDRLARERIRDEVFLNREVADFNDYLRARRDSALLRLNRVSSDYLTDALVNRTEEGMTGYSFIRSVDWNYQSRLGDRRWQSGVNVLGALRETTDDAIAWQMRGFAAEGDSVGGNVGLIYRRVAGERWLLGVNAFLDYENHEYGDFWRWSYGGELRGPWGGLYANHYMAISEERVLLEGLVAQENRLAYLQDVAYTRDGVDAALRISVPEFDWLSGGMTYYQWWGEYGQADDKGFRYHLGFDLAQLLGGGEFWGGLSFDVEYGKPEDGGGEWGGNLTYSHRFGEATPTGGSASTGDGFDPRAHFFDLARREYAQRISRVTTPVTKGLSGELVTVVGPARITGGGVELTAAAGGTVFYPVEATVVVHANGETEAILDFEGAAGATWQAALSGPGGRLQSEGGAAVVSAYGDGFAEPERGN